MTGEWFYGQNCVVYLASRGEITATQDIVLWLYTHDPHHALILNDDFIKLIKYITSYIWLGKIGLIVIQMIPYSKHIYIISKIEVNLCW